MKLAAALLFAAMAFAADPVQSDWTVHDFRFHTGEVLPDLRLHYTTLGAPSGEVVLMLHGTGGEGSAFARGQYLAEMFGPGQPLDAATHYIVMPDGIGHGKSSRPSDGLRAKFPQYNYTDMVTAHYRLLTEHLGVRHVKVIIGSSMGGMHVWLWGEMYPEFMDVLVPLASEPAQVAGRNWMMRRMVIDAIRKDPAWQGGNYTTQPTAFRSVSVFMGIATNGGAAALYRAFPTQAKADQELNRRLAAASTTSDANDVLFQWEASLGYDPGPNLEKITAKVLAVNSADDERNPAELDVMEKALPRLRQAKYVLLPVTDESRGHGTTGSVHLWKQYLVEALSQPKPVIDAKSAPSGR